MLRIIGWLIKTSAFAVIVLVLANYFKVGNKTISDQVKTQLSHAESAAEMTKVPKAAEHLKKNIKTWAHSAELRKRHAIKIVSEEIPSSERQKLRALMRELNSSRETE